MSWVNDLASAFGLPVGAAPIAAAMYYGCVAAEKSEAVRPEALTNIGQFLKDPAWARSVRPSAIIETVFNRTFGEQHLSWRCVARSVSATTIFIAAIVITLYLTKGRYPFDRPFHDPNRISNAGIDLLVNGFLADYVALGKTRLLLRFQRSSAVLLVVLDMVLSFLISFCSFVVVVYVVPPWLYPELQPYTFSQVIEGWKHVYWVLSPDPGLYAIPSVLALSTLLTSIWTVLILLSTAALKLLAPVQRFTASFFDVDKHPLEAIGFVAGALVIIGSLLWSLVRSVI